MISLEGGGGEMKHIGGKVSPVLAIKPTQS